MDVAKGVWPEKVPLGKTVTQYDHDYPNIG